jgi:hypothetical protein
VAESLLFDYCGTKIPHEKMSTTAAWRERGWSKEKNMDTIITLHGTVEPRSRIESYISVSPNVDQGIALSLMRQALDGSSAAGAAEAADLLHDLLPAIEIVYDPERADADLQDALDNI